MPFFFIIPIFERESIPLIRDLDRPDRSYPTDPSYSSHSSHPSNSSHCLARMPPWATISAGSTERCAASGVNARFYDPEVGRFLTQDSYLGEGNNPPSLNRYLYAYSNPLTWTDPTGFAAENKDKGA